MADGRGMLMALAHSTPEVLEHIMSWLGIADLPLLGATCTRLLHMSRVDRRVIGRPRTADCVTLAEHLVAYQVLSSRDNCLQWH